MKKLYISLSIFLWLLSLWTIVLNIIEYERGEFFGALGLAFIMTLLGMILFSGTTKLLSTEKMQNTILIIIVLLGWFLITYVVITSWDWIWSTIQNIIFAVLGVTVATISAIWGRIASLSLNTVLLFIIIYLLIKKDQEKR